MKEVDVKNTIIGMMAEPKAPKDLELATIERGKAIEMGRLAEKKLAELKNAAPSPAIKKLAAHSIVGRVAQTKKMSNGITVDAMVNELMKNEKFQKMTDLSADKLLAGIQTGSLLKNMANQKTKVAIEPTKKEFNGPSL